MPHNVEEESGFFVYSDEDAMSAEKRKVEVLEPRSLAKARRLTDWPVWERVTIEETTPLKKVGTVHGDWKSRRRARA